MLKSAILVTTAIAAILSISSIANAAGKSNHIVTKPNSLHRFTSNLIAKGKKAQIERQDPAISRELPGISQAISEYFKKRNESFAPSANAWSGACGFWEVKSLTMVALSEKKAQVKAEIEQTSYSLLGMNTKPRQWAYQKIDRNGGRQSESNISLEKNDGKWKVTNQ
jgi:hypothetical protein